jgi:hypothetical protein
MDNGENPFASNAERLNFRQLALVVFIVGVLLWGVPLSWQALERFAPSTDYRLPYALSGDYWMFERWCDYAVKKYPCVVIGDSVVWGPYVRKEDALPQALNRMSGLEIFANMGVDGMHPAAMVGLLEYHAASIRDTKVVINLNPLWFTSAKLDLQEDEETNFNHKGLVPQFFSKPLCYKPDFSEQIRNESSRHILFFSWLDHINAAYFDNMGIFRWTMDNSRRNPLKTFSAGMKFEDEQPHNPSVPWTEKDIGEQDYSWVELDKSYQWSSFKKVINILKSRNNEVLVIVGPFNGYMMTKKSMDCYSELKIKMESWLKQNNVSFYTALELPSQFYADASHPVAEGYRMMAEELIKTDFISLFMVEDAKNK